MIKKITLILLFSILLLAPVYAKSNKLRVYPNPWIPESGKSLTGKNDQMKHGAYTADGWIKFEGVNSKNRNNECYGDLRIYDVTGHLIRLKNWTIKEELKIPLPQTSKEVIIEDGLPVSRNNHIVHWDGRDNNNEYVESGVYIWIIREDDGSKYDGKVVVVR